MGHDAPPALVLNLDQTPLSYVSPEKYTFSSKGSKNVPIKGIDDKANYSSSNINEVIRSVLNFLFFYDKILHAQKAQKALKAPKSAKGTKA